MDNNKNFKILLIILGITFLMPVLKGCPAPASYSPRSNASPPSPPTTTPMPIMSPIYSPLPIANITIDMVYIPAGDFYYRVDRKNIYGGGYNISKNEITQSQYKAFIDATGHSQPSGDWDPINKANYPVTYVDFNDAKVFCEWAGGRLPTDKEWEKAAGGTDGRTYPWGKQSPDCTLVNYNETCKGGTAPVGSYPTGVSPYGVYDMAGNVMEWVDYKDKDKTSEIDWYVKRGGGWLDYPDGIYCGAKNSVPSTYKGRTLGFRLAKDKLPNQIEPPPTPPTTPPPTPPTTPPPTPPTTPPPPPTIPPTVIASGTTQSPIEIEMVTIPAGNFTMGSDTDPDAFSFEKPQHTVTLSAYSISKYEITQGQYKKFIDASSHAAPTKDWDPVAKANYPVTNVDWNDAKAFCEWSRGRLPTEAEWEKAARGSDGRKYPWGNNIDSSRANYSSSRTKLVGSYPSGASPYGVMDMAGNVWEWCNDWYDSNYYATSPSSNPQGPGSGSSRVVRGGSWNYAARYVRCAYRDSNTPSDRFGIIGFRLVR